MGNFLHTKEIDSVPHREKCAPYENKCGYFGDNSLEKSSEEKIDKLFEENIRIRVP